MDRKSLLFVLFMTTTFFALNQFLFPPRPGVQLEGVTPPALQAPSLLPEPKETLYVIENDYQQLVISSINGAVAEINLPLQTAKHSLSVIKKIDIDDILEKNYPSLDHFPSKGYTSYQGIFSQGKLGGYYPLLRRGVSPQYYGLTTTTTNPATVYTSYKVKRLEKNLIELEGVTEGITVTKTYTLPANPSQTPYSFELKIQTPQDLGSLNIATGIPEVEIISGGAAPSLKYLYKNPRQRQIVQQISLPKKTAVSIERHPEWVSNSNGFFALLINSNTSLGSTIHAEQIAGDQVPSRLTFIDQEYDRYPAANFPGYNVTLPLKSFVKECTFQVFAGPLDSHILKTNDEVLQANFSGMQSLHGWFAFISEPFAQFLFLLMRLFHATIHSWGFSIILLTIALRFMMYPLNAWSIKSTLKMQKLSPKLASLQERYKKDPKQAQMEIMTLYKEHGVNPLGGCLPLILQMPFLMGMFDLLKSTFELRGVSFIPGWITNLTSPDVIFSWNTPLLLIGNSFHLLPILLGVVMFFQQRMSSPQTTGTKELSDQQKQQKIMGNVMVVVFTVLFYKFPSGLNIYWLSSMLLAILQQWWTKHKGIRV
ncbi:MAG: membrane protein insertase YidC [Candidatus Rhabdochlamydia sp.]